MEPSERVETVTKSKVAYPRERTEGAGDQPGPTFMVDPGEASAVIADWPAAPKKDGHRATPWKTPALTLLDEYKRHPRYSSLMADGYQNLTLLTTAHPVGKSQAVRAC